MLLLSLLLSASISFSLVAEPGTNVVWHWEDEFNTVEKNKIETWLTRVTKATEETLGIYPFDLHLFIHRRDGSSEPVPWASTRRHSLQGVDFYIDPSYSLQSFLDDWTAPHEISHLSIPFLGKNQAWFAEGYASFMQYQIMQTLGVRSPEQVKTIYKEKIERCKPSYNRKEDFVTVARELRSRNRYPDMYWGGASYFIQMNQQLLEEHGISLTEVIQDYMLCCRLVDEDLDGLVKSWDHLLNETIFSQMLENYRSLPASEILTSFK
ncbi:MAG: hypothetical protein QNK35_13150 [Bacteroides sp.]|nr:hypothetical protein [Bacteroides sp.]